MRIARFAQQIAAWLGLVAVGLGSLAPLGDIAEHARADALIGICTASGFRYLPEAPQAPSPLPAPAERTQCTLCAHCAPSSGHAALAAGSPRIAPAWLDGTSAPRPHVSPLPSLPWIPGARPREPPAALAVL
jgi:hypothetical protein